MALSGAARAMLRRLSLRSWSRRSPGRRPPGGAGGAPRARARPRRRRPSASRGPRPGAVPSRASDVQRLAVMTRQRRELAGLARGEGCGPPCGAASHPSSAWRPDADRRRGRVGGQRCTCSCSRPPRRPGGAARRRASAGEVDDGDLVSGGGRPSSTWRWRVFNLASHSDRALAETVFRCGRPFAS